MRVAGYPVRAAADTAAKWAPPVTGTHEAPVLQPQSVMPDVTVDPKLVPLNGVHSR